MRYLFVITAAIVFNGCFDEAEQAARTTKTIDSLIDALDSLNADSKRRLDSFRSNEPKYDSSMFEFERFNPDSTHNYVLIDSSKYGATWLVPQENK